MPNTTLKEKDIQADAIEFLWNYYKKSSSNRLAYSESEAHTKKRKRADGLIVWQRGKNRFRVASVEAKSATTLRNLRSRWDKDELNKGSLKTVQIVILIVIGILYSVSPFELHSIPLWVFILFVVLNISLPFGTKFLQKFFPRMFTTAEVIEQVRKYPGNEMWIAIGYDTFKKKEERKKFIQLCKDKGVGLLEVFPYNTHIEILLTPQFIKYDGFLKLYKSADKAIVYLRQQGKYFFNLPSKAERLFWFQHYILSAVSACVLIVFLAVPSDFDNHTSTVQIIPDLPIKINKEKSLDDRKSTDNAIKNVPETFTEKGVNTNCKKKISGTKYILKEQLFETEYAAKNRVKKLLKAGFPKAGYLWLPCYDSPLSYAEVYCVYAYPPQENEKKIKNSLRRYPGVMKKAGLKSMAGVDIWKVRFKE